MYTDYVEDKKPYRLQIALTGLVTRMKELPATYTSERSRYQTQSGLWNYRVMHVS